MREAKAATILPQADAGRLKRELLRWTEGNAFAEPLPAGVEKLLPAAMAAAERQLRPATPDDRTALMQRLWDCGVPQPHPVTMAEWHRLLAALPADILAEAFDQVARTHRWKYPPKIADVVRFAEPAMAERWGWRRKIETALLKARLQPLAKSPRRPLRQQSADEINAFFAAIRERHGEAFGISRKGRGQTEQADLVAPL